ncbi:MAG: thermonuclease family protein [Betaproteobacteria bacterium]|nr:thermonuclease family protein [Betaproteobacteria bacterium]MDE2309734.1 thermonuclease family protein [Betaproteobacteria bacterium]
MRALLLFLLLACTFSTARAEEFSAKVIAVLDGDTVLVLRGCKRVEPEAPGTHRRPPCGGSQKVKVRLVNIDAPEKAQEYGMASRQSLAEMVLRKQVQVSSQAMDEYGRMVAQIEAGGLKVNEEQVRRGMAWEYSHFHSDRHFIALQHEAQQARRGLWAQSSPMPPWQWRKLHAADAPPQRAPEAQGYACGSKKHCSEMSSCEEARYYFTNCGIKALDGDGDGVPCEKLCAPAARNDVIPSP